VADSIVAPLKLTPQEHIAYVLLMQRATVSRDAMIEAFYSTRPDSDWPEGPDMCVAAVISRLRSKLASCGIRLVSTSSGWALPSRAKASLQAMTPWWDL
jgi:hypothetical protein